MDDDIGDPYEVLGVASNAEESVIKTAYKKLSLKWHPDKNKDPSAPSIFDRLNRAYTLLTDTEQREKRLKVDRKLKEDKAKKERYAGLEAKRKAQVDDLLEREESAKRVRVEKAQEGMMKKRKLEEVREESRKAMEAAQKKREMEERTTADTLKPKTSTLPTAALTSTKQSAVLKLRWAVKDHPAYENQSTLQRLLSDLAQAPIDGLLVKAKPAKTAKKGDSRIAIVSLLSIAAAQRIVNIGLNKVEVSWMSKDGEGDVGVDPPPPSSGKVAPSFASAAAPPVKPNLDLDEVSILSSMRARQAERERLAEELRRQDELEEAGA